MFLKLMCHLPFDKRRYVKKLFAIMKFTAILLFAACTQVSASGNAQKITLSQNNVSLKKIFKEIENQSGYHFFYKDKLLREARNVNIHVRDATLQETLDLCLKGQPLSYNILDKTVIIKERKLQAVTEPVFALPEITGALASIITGIVRDAQGNPLPGVSVVVKGTVKGTSTGTNGGFNIEANVGDELEFTMVGYQKKTVTVGQTTNLNVVMEIDNSVEDEVVVTALGIRREVKSLGYSITKVDNKEFSKVHENNFMNSLVGKVAGLDVSGASAGPFGSSRITIRGNTSIAGDNQPLYVINGIPMDNTKFGESANEAPNWGDNVSSLNGEDIQDITVLKGATAAALYGSRAKNGAIVITTKSGKGQTGFGVEFNSHNTFDVPHFIWQLQKEYGQGYGGFRPASKEDAANHGQNHWGCAI